MQCVYTLRCALTLSVLCIINCYKAKVWLPRRAACPERLWYNSPMRMLFKSPKLWCPQKASQWHSPMSMKGRNIDLSGLCLWILEKKSAMNPVYTALGEVW